MAENKKISGLTPMGSLTLSDISGFAGYVASVDGAEAYNIKCTGQELMDGIFKIQSAVEEGVAQSKVEALPNATVQFSVGGSNNYQWKLSSSGHFIPGTNAAFDLGNASFKVRHLFLSDSSIYMGATENTTDAELARIYLKNEDERPLLLFSREGEGSLQNFEGSIMTNLSSEMDGASFDAGTLTLPAFPNIPEPVEYTAQEPLEINDNVISYTGEIFTSEQAGEITANTAKVGITPQQAEEITTNTAKVGITTEQAGEITANTAKVGITTEQAGEITANTAKVSANNGLLTINVNGTEAGTFGANASENETINITAGGGEVNYTNFNTVNNKADLSEENQTIYGHSEKYTANGVINNGQPVIYNYTSNQVRAIAISALPNQTEVIGIALNDATDGNPVDVLTEGFCTARRTTTLPETNQSVTQPSGEALEAYNLSVTEGGTYSDGPGSYSSSTGSTVQWTVDGSNAERYMTLNFTDAEDWGFEGGNSVIYDRLFFEVSMDNETYVQFNWKWGLKVENNLPGVGANDALFNEGDWDDTVGGNYVNAKGCTLPRLKEWAITFNDGEEELKIDFVVQTADPVFGPEGTPWKYIRANFVSDGSVTSAGWESVMEATPTYVGEPVSENIPINAAVLLNAADLTKTAITTDANASTIILGNTVAENANNDAILIRLLHNH